MFAQSRCSAARRARGSPATSRHTAHRLRLAAQRSSAVRPLGNDFAEPRPAVIDLLTRRGPGAPGGPDAPSTSAASHTHQQRKIDILGIGQAIVDYAATVDDAMLEKFALPKGGRRCDAPLLLLRCAKVPTNAPCSHIACHWRLPTRLH